MAIYRNSALSEAQAQSQRQLENGGIPVLAEQRLQVLKGQLGGQEPALFTSDLSVNSFALATETGLRPVSQVMGSSVYQAAVAADRAVMAFTADSPAEPGKTYRMSRTAEPWNAARALALKRMTLEAVACGADAVVGVRVVQGEQDFAAVNGATLEFIATGTAVVRADRAGRPPAEPALTGLSVQEYWKLRQRRYRPVGLVAYTSVVGCVPTQNTRQAQLDPMHIYSGRYNREFREYGNAVRIGYRMAFTELRHQAEAVHAFGIVGVHVDHSQHFSKTKDTARTTDVQLIVIVHAYGTAIARDPSDQAAAGSSPATSVRSVLPVLRLDQKGDMSL